MEKSEIYEKCHILSNQLGLCLYDDADGVSLTNGEVDFQNKDDVSYTKNLLYEARAKLTELGIVPSLIKRVGNVLYININYPKTA